MKKNHEFIFYNIKHVIKIKMFYREKAYLEGGIHFVSTRILVVDLLKNRVPISHTSGIIVLRAHTVLESCQEAFALRLYRQGNKVIAIYSFLLFYVGMLS